MTALEQKFFNNGVDIGNDMGYARAKKDFIKNKTIQLMKENPALSDDEALKKAKHEANQMFSF